MEVVIRDLQSLPVDVPLLEAVAREAAGVGVQAADAPADCPPDAISIAIVDDARIRELNRSYLGRDTTTDVIAFEAEDEPDRRAGEVIVSAETALRQADEYGHSHQRELCLLVAHGVLHVLGYEDYDEGARARMLELGERALAQTEGGEGDCD
ncbi:MAG: rRNA maturation RNase YbeY [Armatimonadia bacterium]|nr:rRNA maturation RNase YbeY [Armatimonadia bacterium]